MKNWIMATLFALTVGGGIFATVVPSNVYAANDDCNAGFLGFPSWYRGLTDKDNNCNITFPNKEDKDALSKFIWTIILNIIDIALMAVGYLSAFYIMFGGFKYITARGAPDDIVKAKQMILRAIYGLVISLVSVGAINFIVEGLFGQ